MTVSGVIDSINLSSPFIGLVFQDTERFVIEEVKTPSTFNPTRWSDEFGARLTRNINEAFIVHCYNGAALPLKRYSNKKDNLVVEFAGLHGYTQKSSDKRDILTLIKDNTYLQSAKVTRLDLAIDKERFSQRTLKQLQSRGKSFKYANTFYFKTAKEKRKNSYFDVKLYDKAVKENLAFDLMRLEYCFKSSYIQNTSFAEVEKIYPKIERTIKDTSLLNVDILPL